ncbi:hypothetical protein MAR_026330 [Mya arenaria]|uniref:Uncharacterized protein n=1 Tax=Mya arenaria TaxID=6604 RepID=A0ABY7EQM9_MYAAR|nr:hypothetical protein MAR_026330 [Mya arenaria]
MTAEEQCRLVDDAETMRNLALVLFIGLALFPSYDIHAQQATSIAAINRSLDPRFLNWLNSLFYIPPEGEIRVRKEYRMLTDTERNNFHNSIRALKQDTVHFHFGRHRSDLSDAMSETIAD